MVCWLAAHYADMSEAIGVDEGPNVTQLRIKQAESANRHFLAAVKALAVVRRLAGGLRIEISHNAQGASVAGAGADEGVDSEPVAERLRSLVHQASRSG